jgi:hypothetical protein
MKLFNEVGVWTTHAEGAAVNKMCCYVWINNNFDKETPCRSIARKSQNQTEQYKKVFRCFSNPPPKVGNKKLLELV